MAARGKRSNAYKAMIGVYQDTQHYFSDFDLKSIPPATKYIISGLPVITDFMQMKVCPVTVENVDTFDAAGEFARKGMKTMVLNMASAVSPGGGVAAGKTAQEECLFRRSNAFLAHPKDLYPIKSDECLYSPDILVIKNFDYVRMKTKDFFSVSMLTLPALRKPRRIGERYVNEKDREIMRARIDAIFKIALLNNIQVLILGALGCGAYDNPPGEIISIFQGCLTKYRSYFEHITFAILAVGPNGEENFAKFSKTLHVV